MDNTPLNAEMDPLRQLTPRNRPGKAPATAELLDAAATLAANRATHFDDAAAQAKLAVFLRLYSNWIVLHRGMSDTLATWAEQSKILSIV